MKAGAKILIGLALLAAFGFLFIRSLQTSRSASYTVEGARLKEWSLALEPASSPTAPLLVLRGPMELVSGLFRQVFTRAMESLVTPGTAAIPVVLKGEFDESLSGVMTEESLLFSARESGLETAAVEPRCLAHRRISQPGGTRQVYVAVFDSPEFVRFRQALAERAGRAGNGGTAFDAAALSPVMFVAGADGAFHRWLPLRVETDADCVAPLERE